MINFFHKLKHWQLFILMIGIPVILQLGVMASIIPNIKGPSSEFEVLGFFKYYFIVALFYLFAFYGWIWSIVVGLNHLVPREIDMKLKRFKIAFFIPVVYFIILTLVMSFYFPSFIERITINNTPPNPRVLIGSMAVILPIHLLSIFCIFYCYYFVAKTLKSIELKREAKFDEYIGEFALVWIYFIGIWFLQPKINTLVENNKTINK